MKTTSISKFVPPSLLALLLLWSLGGCGKSRESRIALDVSAIAGEISEGVAVVGRCSADGEGAPIMVLEENHASRAGQIQQAVILVRLYERKALRHIALEGYLKEEQPISTEWWNNTFKDALKESKMQVAVRLLKEGEISSAEFLKLAYRDVSLSPAETRDEYPGSLDSKAFVAPLVYLFRIAERSLTEQHGVELKRHMEEFERLQQDDDKNLAEVKRKEIFDYVISVDAWAQQKARALQDTSSIIPEEEQLRMVQEIVERAKGLSIRLEAEEEEFMAQYLDFYNKRFKATKTMSLSAGDLADLPDVSVVALIIGAAHTKGTCDALGEENRPYGVIKPLALERHDTRGDIPWEMLERKYKRLSVYSEGLTELICNSVPMPRDMKPKTVLSEPWFQAKAELYFFTDRICTDVLRPGGPPGGGKPPYGYSSDDLSGMWVYIDPERISVILDADESKGKAVLFPAVLNPRDNQKRKEIWVKASLGAAAMTSLSRETTEAMLKRALEEVISEEAPGKKREDIAGKIQITLNTVASFAQTEQAVRKVILGTI